jgi:hypothetical protein
MMTMEGPIVGDNQPKSSDGRLRVNNDMVEMERHPSVYLPSGAPNQAPTIGNEASTPRSKNHVTNPGMTGLQTSETQTLF